MLKMVKWVSAVAMMAGFANAAYATGEGFYFGTMLGVTNLHGQQQTGTIPTTPPTVVTLKPDSSGVGIRLFLGGNFNKYFGMEGGFTYFSSGKYKTTVVTNNIRTRAGSVDLLGKGMLPIAESGFGIFGKAGLAYVNTSTTGSIGGFSISRQRNSTVRPELAIGASYDITQRWVADLSYTTILYNSTYVKNPSFTALGISYHFVDEYCGQFLC